MAKRRRPRRSGSVYRRGNIWWVSYIGPDGLRREESSESTRKGDAERLIQQKVGARENNLPVVKNAGRLTFAEAARAVTDDFKANGKRSLGVLQQRLDLHLIPYFGARRMAGITTADVDAYKAFRQEEGIRRKQDVKVGGTTERQIVRVADVSNATINRELQTLKHAFGLAIKGGRLATKPHIGLLKESAPRQGFFEADQLAGVLRHLPTEVRPVIQFAAITGWRMHSEVLPLEWRQVDFNAGEVTLDAGTTKNGAKRVFKMTSELRTLLKAQHVKHERLKKAGLIEPRVFFRMVAEGRGGPKKPQAIKAFHKAWKKACIAAGCPGRIPHDLRRTAVRNFVRVGIPERVAMRLSGHKTASVFARYDIVSPGDLDDAARRLEAAAPLRRARRS